MGPAILIPTATDDLLGSDHWGAGPTLVALRQTETKWTYGVLMNQIWTFAGDEDHEDISQMFLQPFVTKGRRGRTTPAPSSAPPGSASS